MNESLTSSERVLKFVPPGEPPRFYAFGPFRLSTSDRQLFRGGEAIPLPPKTGEMLLLLVEKRGEVVTKETLMSELWPDTFVEESNLAQHVFRLRKALQEGGDPERYIETIPRRGYRFVADVREDQSSRGASWIALVLASLVVAVAAVAVSTHDRVRPMSARAREAYLKGEHHWNRRTEADLRRSIEYFRIAVEEEPDHALAWAGLARAYNMTGQAMRAKAAAVRALELDDQSAHAHAALGNVKLFHDYDFAAAERELRRSIELDPSYATAHHWLAFALLVQKKFDAAVAEIERARQLDPASLIINTDVGDIYYYARRYDDAIRVYRRTLDLDPNFAEARSSLAFTLLRKGMFAEARAELEATRTLTGQVPDSGELDVSAGFRGKALQDALAREAEFEAGRNLGMRCAVVRTYAGAGEIDRALLMLERAHAEHDGNLALIHVDPGFDPLRRDPRFDAFVRTHGLALFP